MSITACTGSPTPQVDPSPILNPTTHRELTPSPTPSPLAVVRTPTITSTLPAPPSPNPAPSTQPALSTPGTPTPRVCLQSGGRYDFGEIKTPLLRAPLTYRVYLPPCYDQELQRSYPVLYLIHGQSYTDEQWDQLGADETADTLIAAGDLPPFIIVMPRDRIWAQPSEDNFGQALIQLLVPLIDDTYRTKPDRQFRAIGGLSRGASWAVHLGFSQWELFGSIGLHSPPVFWEDVDYVKDWIKAIPSDQLPRIYMDIGSRDRQEIMVSAVWFEELLTTMGIPHEWHLFAGYHNEEYWQKHIEKYLRWYALNWAEK